MATAGCSARSSEAVRISFIYLERCVVHRDSNAITATDEKGVIHISAATLAVRNKVHDGALLDRCVRDIRSLLLNPGPSGPIDNEWPDDDIGEDSVRLWDESGVELAAGRNYSGYKDF